MSGGRGDLLASGWVISVPDLGLWALLFPSLSGS